MLQAFTVNILSCFGTIRSRAAREENKSLGRDSSREIKYELFTVTRRCFKWRVCNLHRDDIAFTWDVRDTSSAEFYIYHAAHTREVSSLGRATDAASGIALWMDSQIRGNFTWSSRG